ncbi:4Fe-4S dicluster domain-containing protein [Thermodesulfobacteriota bacterium]
MPKNKKPQKKETSEQKKYSRRQFLVGGSAAIAAGALAATPGVKTAEASEEVSYPESKGYLVYDSKKCIGCTTCMLSCSMVHYGEQNLSLSRIQIMQDSFGKFPDDLQIAPCRQCVTPPCVINCPVGAAFIDTENGNVRRINEEECIGCKKCLEMCPQQPHRPVWNHIDEISSKCDLCIDTPYWDEKGGPGGKQACVESCPMQAIKLVTEAPDQKETEGYNINLRNDHWFNLGLVDDSRKVPPRMQNMGMMFGGPKFKPKPKAKR